MSKNIHKYDFDEIPDNYLYIWMRENGTPFYIGIGRNKRYKYLHRRNPHTLNIVRKMGGIHKVPKKIIPVKNWEAACKLEIKLIKKYGRTDTHTGSLTNKTDGGEGTVNKIISTKVRKAVSKANSNRIWSDDSREAMSKSLKGRPVSKSTRKKLKEAFIGKSRPQHVLDAMKTGVKKAIANGTHKYINTEKHKKHFKEVVQEAARVWHGSKEGIEFHKKLGKETWKNKKGTEVKCQFCDRSFITPFPSRAKYCHANCKQSALRKRRGQNVGTRPARKKITDPKNWTNS
jgi:hypothetical protein